jgi:hypothetical protein
LEFHEDSADLFYSILADGEAEMPRKSRNAQFEPCVEKLRAHSFEVTPRAGGGVLVSKDGVGAVLVAGSGDAPTAFAVSPGLLDGDEVTRLLDRGNQKFIHSSRGEGPATASQLHAIHRFTEELKLLTGALSLYNESLGTTSDLYQYDRLQGRPGGPSAAPGATGGH